jgi:hypothetical protein
MPMTAQAASDATARVAPAKALCKPRANCLKPKEIAKPAPIAASDALTYSTYQPLLFADIPPTPSQALTR